MASVHMTTASSVVITETARMWCFYVIKPRPWSQYPVGDHSDWGECGVFVLSNHYHGHSSQCDDHRDAENCDVNGRVSILFYSVFPLDNTG